MAVTDPVCGMTIEERDAPATSEYEGVTYFFCGAACKEQFDAQPESLRSPSGRQHKIIR